MKTATCWLVLLLIIFGFTLAAPKLTKLGTLPKAVLESSGIETGDEAGTFVTHNDAGNAPELFLINRKGQLLRTIEVPGATNLDWEDITRDTKGNLYICDTGNNNNKRTELQIYKFSLKSPDKAEKITLHYPDQKPGAKSKKGASFDVEATFWCRNKIYLLTKDRVNGNQTKLYEVPDQPGNHEAKLRGTYPVNGKVTAADLSPDQKKLVLLSTGQLHVYQPKGTNFLQNKIATVALKSVGQTEGVAFTDNQTVVFTNEKGDLYQYSF
ncbi:MAG: hypothetical protein AVDCRST_MAG95-553 [uncultured Adhaeribacter sp.]|uniref:Uncharacterized protein n=1 Tax=uncultured Adhaeribacter sp. TaxID=448109 RepID=A0A6J4HEH7_9BACT|nr:MAG: hypothetical protein AVDCRST_MAG95-553 [uncultured Adhaeribacter sp.]